MKLVFCHFSGVKNFGVTYFFFLNSFNSWAMQHCVYSVSLSFFWK